MVDQPSLLVGVDGRELLGRPTGVGRYLRELLSVWASDAAMPHRFRVFVPSQPSPDTAAFGPCVTWNIVAADRGGTWWEQMRLPRAVADAGVDVFFAAGYTAPLRLACPSVVAIYDVSFWAHPEWFSAREGTRRRWLTRASARRARRIITISEFSAAEIVRYLGVGRDRIDLAPPGSPPGPLARPLPIAPVVLFVGSLLTRRHISDLIRAFGVVAGRIPHARLVLVGDNRTSPPIDPPAIARDLGIGDRVDWREDAPDAEVADLYATARVFAFLSDYEGFAMTPLEALARGVPPVLLDTPVAREVYGAAARYTTTDPAAIADALCAMWDEGPDRTAVLEAAPGILSRYTWHGAAAVVQGALEEAATSGRARS